MIRFFHAADIHLDSPLKGLEGYEDAPVNEIRGATRRAFDNLIDLAIDIKVDFVLLAGDLYDGGWKDYNTGLFFIDRMSRLRKENIRVFLVSGNHDAASQITKALPLPDNVTLFPAKKPETIFLDDLNVAIHGQSYQTRAVIENLATNFPHGDPHYFNIGLLHTALTGRPGHEPYAPCTLDNLCSKGYEYWALGHIHQREVVSENPWVVFSGTIQGRHIREAGPKGATLVTVEEGQVSELEHYDIDVLRWSPCRVDVSACETLGSVIDQTQQALENELDRADARTLAVRLILEGASPAHSMIQENTVHITEELRSLTIGLGNVWLEKVLFNTCRPKNHTVTLADDSPVTRLLQSIENMDFDADQLLDLVPEIEVLKSKLPPELLSGEESFPPKRSDQFDELLRDVKELLAAKLIRHGGES